ncbi:aldehyde dehydrogenase family protein [Pseudoalteromonas sp. OOF1S-7]|nr:aldehyde dehydrogenase family protein [Pseudoalteromonas sp. OOF1S-7]
MQVNIIEKQDISSVEPENLSDYKEYGELLNSSSKLVESLVSNAECAKLEILAKSDQELEEAVIKIAQGVAELSEEFVNEEYQQSKIGNIVDKTHKLSIVTDLASKDLLGIKTFGAISEQDGVTEYASPVGVIFAIVPLTNPIPNSLYKILNAIRTRNSIIISYPKKTVSIGLRLIKLVNSILSNLNFPKDLVQALPLTSSRELVQQVMSHPGIDLILATGGSSLVKAVLSSGNPAYTVGPGNVPALIFDDADLGHASRCIVKSKAYDNGIICGSESNLIVDSRVYTALIKELEQSGAAVLSESEKERATQMWFEEQGGLKTSMVGKPAQYLAVIAGIERDYLIRTLVIPCRAKEVEYYCWEKLAPVMSILNVHQSQLISVAEKLLSMDGEGHTAAIHTMNKETELECAERLSAGRILVNCPATFGMMGVTSHLPISFMLGSGTWGSCISTDAITWRHLLNIKRLSHYKENPIVNLY